MAYVGADRVIAMARQAAARGLNESAREIADESIRRVPKLTGRLASSAHIQWATPEHLRAEVSFNAPYATEVHEGLPRDEPERAPSAKYLEGSMYQEIPYMVGRIEHELQPLRVLRGIVGGIQPRDP